MRYILLLLLLPGCATRSHVIHDHGYHPVVYKIEKHHRYHRRHDYGHH